MFLSTEKLTNQQWEIIAKVKDFISKSRGPAILLIFSCKADGVNQVGCGVTTALYHALVDFVGSVDWCCASRIRLDQTRRNLLDIHVHRTYWKMTEATPHSLCYRNPQFRTCHKRYLGLFDSLPLSPEADMVVYDDLCMHLFEKAFQVCLQRSTLRILAFTARASELDRARELIQSYHASFDMVHDMTHGSNITIPPPITNSSPGKEKKEIQQEKVHKAILYIVTPEALRQLGPST